MNYGFVPSKMDGTEFEFDKIENMDIPESYSYKKYLPKVINQGNKPICVPCSISSYINWNMNLETGDNKFDNNINLLQIFNSRTNKSNDGMSFKDAFKYLKHDGVETDNGIYRIGRYAKIGSEIPLKQAIIMNGPCVGGLPVYDSNVSDFWTRYPGLDFQGGHAIAIVGYNKDGFIIRNSWGEYYGDKGYSVLPYEDFDNFTEIWTIID